MLDCDLSSAVNLLLAITSGKPSQYADCKYLFFDSRRLLNPSHVDRYS